VGGALLLQKSQLDPCWWCFAAEFPTVLYSNWGDTKYRYVQYDTWMVLSDASHTGGRAVVLQYDRYRLLLMTTTMHCARSSAHAASGFVTIGTGRWSMTLPII